jgi:hypothetical protein
MADTFARFHASLADMADTAVRAALYVNDPAALRRILAALADELSAAPAPFSSLSANSLSFCTRLSLPASFFFELPHHFGSNHTPKADVHARGRRIAEYIIGHEIDTWDMLFAAVCSSTAAQSFVMSAMPKRDRAILQRFFERGSQADLTLAEQVR